MDMHGWSRPSEELSRGLTTLKQQHVMDLPEHVISDSIVHSLCSPLL